jgi:hypothetical protein
MYVSELLHFWFRAHLYVPPALAQMKTDVMFFVSCAGNAFVATFAFLRAISCCQLNRK